MKGEWGIDLSCVICKHLNIDDERQGTCKAYPKRIPHAILSGEFDHRKPFPGDHGIQFEPIKKED